MGTKLCKPGSMIQMQFVRINRLHCVPGAANNPFPRNEIFFILLSRVMTATYTLFLVKGHVEDGTDYCRENILEVNRKSRGGR
jgi:hypothetical protein